MNWKLFFVTFASIFMAELGDKTQLATISFTADNAKYKWIVFLGAAGALVLTSFIGVFFGHLITKIISPRNIKILAAVSFILIGAFMLISAFREPQESLMDKPAARISQLIKEIQAIEKCNHCQKFNDFLNANKSNIGVNINVNSENLHSPYNCENCNTDRLQKTIDNFLS